MLLKNDYKLQKVSPFSHQLRGGVPNEHLTGYKEAVCSGHSGEQKYHLGSVNKNWL